MTFSTSILISLLLIQLSFFECLCKTNSFSSHRSLTARLKLKRAMEEHSIVPDVINAVPQSTIEVRYPSGVQVKLGNELTPTNVKDMPSVKWPIEQNAFYTLAMVDPDAPSRQNSSYGPMKHWLVVNIPGLEIEKGETLAEYIGSGAPEGTGLHRYVFLVYKQSARLEHSETFSSNRTRAGRPKFQIGEFAQKYSLGQPIAANFFQAQYDDYVPILRQQLSNN